MIDASVPQAQPEVRILKTATCTKHVEDAAEIIRQRFQGAALLCKWPERYEQGFGEALDPI